MQKLYHRYSEPVRIRFLGAFLTSITGSMLAPFMIIYLHEQLDGNLLLPMLIVGLQPLSDIIFTLLGGGITDRYGRKQMMMIALFMQAISMAGFIFAESVFFFALLYVLNGIGRSIFIPAQRAQIVDCTEVERRSEVFSIISTIESFAITIGPLLGLLVYSYQPDFIFGLEALSLFLYAIIVWLKLPETAPKQMTKEIETNSATSALTVQQFLRKHHFVLGIMVFSIPISFFYSQVETNYKIFVQDLFPNYLTVLTIITTVKALMITFLQIVLVKWTEKLPMTKIVAISYLCFFISAIGFGFSTHLFWLLFTQLILTVGQSIGLNHFLRYVSELAPEQHRGLYFSLYGIHWDISRTVGPFVGGLLLLHGGGELLFLLSAIFLIVGGIGQYLFVSYIHRKQMKNQQEKIILLHN
ncbi:MDR family MFS transporter [Bacillus salitolerans]|uniref:MDR family MFS transporter n=1 Tax=Bacillus salitolerans TaxID=1437434 RepID=A0ABW4LZ15_9BACI